ncbi:hypothetical protein CMUST_07460 [Corynebacterium mustelae]|uniref:N-acetyltransferase domain-containing protein n=1 Tax=Corynebacterium mustelae TaxID=571915 RepID=A0A0G3GXC0_9CORY|nr:GNAT family N-acetyltransferase [Corynebacterium mustelae]AKK05821.1 hypothetical protein CMUST_07460 [Corynebacterium mustelae]
MRIFTPVVWPNAAVDQYVVSAPIATIASHFSPTLENVQLRGMSADEAIKVERSIYTKLREVNPRISRKFHLLTADQISPGMAWSVSTDGELIGMVACAIDSQFGIDGIALTSICLVPQHHGKKFGKATLIHLARELADSEAYKTKELWGHIVMDTTKCLWLMPSRLGEKLSAHTSGASPSHSYSDKLLIAC